MNEAEKFLAARNSIGQQPPIPSQDRNTSAQDSGSFLKERNRASHAGALVGLMLLSGLFSILTAILRQLTIGLPNILAAVVVAPPVEEILKVAIPIMVLEHRAKWIGRGQDFLWFVLGSALLFGIVENILYTFVYLDNPSSALLWWRWIACTTMHLVASGLAGVGLMRAFNRAQRTDEKARFVWEWPWLVGAIAVHMVFNTFAVFFAEPF